MLINYALLHSLTVLYVEDEHFLQEEIKENLSPFVKRILTASDGEEGLALFHAHENEIDLIITDILMPKLNGIEMIDAIRKTNFEVPVIYTTAFNDSEHLQRTVSQSVDAYILKPIDFEALLQGMHKASLKVENQRLKYELQTINENLEKQIVQKTHELKAKNSELLRQVYTDDLTRLPNRKALIRDLASAENPIVGIVDIDAFKHINDAYGGKVGNAVLVEVAKLLRKVNCDNKFVFYRLGADEFAFFTEIQCDLKKCTDFIESILSQINTTPLTIEEDNLSLYINVTIGVSQESENALERADMALKKAKTDHLPYLIYSTSHDLDSEYQNYIHWTKIIREAIDTDNILPYFQPIVDADGKPLKYESLMRLKQDDRVHSPFTFLEIAKRAKFYPALTKLIIEKTFLYASKHHIEVSINLSIQDLVDDTMVDFIKERLLHYNVAHLVTFEFTESESIKDYNKVQKFIRLVKVFGAKIAIDDFGSGYSNFSYLLELQPDFIKIDGSLIKDIHNDRNSYIITKTIIDFTQQLGIKTIAEYVHCKEVFEILKALGIDEFQGFYFSVPKEHIDVRTL